MNDIDQTRQRLTEQLEDAIDRAERIEERLRQTGDEDWEEQAIQRENDEVLESLGKRLYQEIDEIKQAIHRIDSGSYGICVRCGKALSQERLEAVPYATACVECS